MLKSTLFRQGVISGFIAVFMFVFVMTAFAGVDVNKATQAELDAITGIGPVTAQKILDERKKGNFKDWDDLISRVKGIGDANSAKMSGSGLTVNGKAMGNAPAKESTKPNVKAKPETKAEPK